MVKFFSLSLSKNDQKHVLSIYTFIDVGLFFPAK